MPRSTYPWQCLHPLRHFPRATRRRARGQDPALPAPRVAEVPPRSPWGHCPWTPYPPTPLLCRAAAVPSRGGAWRGSGWRSALTPLHHGQSHRQPRWACQSLGPQQVTRDQSVACHAVGNADCAEYACVCLSCAHLPLLGVGDAEALVHGCDVVTTRGAMDVCGPTSFVSRRLYLLLIPHPRVLSTHPHNPALPALPFYMTPNLCTGPLGPSSTPEAVLAGTTQGRPAVSVAAAAAAGVVPQPHPPAAPCPAWAVHLAAAPGAASPAHPVATQEVTLESPQPGAGVAAACPLGPVQRVAAAALGA
jgi:hypothetical protein